MDGELPLQELIALAETKIQLGLKLTKDLSDIEHIDGVKKIQRKIKNELATLVGVTRGSL